MMRSIVAAFALILATAAQAEPTNREIQRFMACMRSIMPVLSKHTPIDHLGELIHIVTLSASLDRRR